MHRHLYLLMFCFNQFFITDHALSFGGCPRRENPLTKIFISRYPKEQPSWSRREMSPQQEHSTCSGGRLQRATTPLYLRLTLAAKVIHPLVSHTPDCMRNHQKLAHHLALDLEDFHKKNCIHLLGSHCDSIFCSYAKICVMDVGTETLKGTGHSVVILAKGGWSCVYQICLPQICRCLSNHLHAVLPLPSASVPRHLKEVELYLWINSFVILQIF